MNRTGKISEAAFQAQVIDLARLMGWLVAHFRCVRVQRRDGSVFYQTPVQADGAGFPDLILLRTTRMVAAELKIPPNRPTVEQVAWLQSFALAGVESYTWTPDEWPEIEKVLAR